MVLRCRSSKSPLSVQAAKKAFGGLVAGEVEIKLLGVEQAGFLRHARRCPGVPLPREVGQQRQRKLLPRRNARVEQSFLAEGRQVKRHGHAFDVRLRAIAAAGFGFE